MADIFSARAGFVAVLPSDRVIPGRVHLEGFNPEAALIAGVDADQRTNQQFQTSLDGSVYIYSFGDLMGSVIIRGIAFPAVCGSGAQEGLIEVFDFYTQNRASKNPTPVEVQIGNSEVIIGFLTGLRVQAEAVAEDPSSFISTYTMTVNALPKK